MSFPSTYSEIQKRIDQIDPVKYGRTRNYIDGSVTRLSPYISRGVISTRMVYEQIMNRDLPFPAIEKLVQELAWRDYWQQVWIAKGDLINDDLKRPQAEIMNHKIPEAIIAAKTEIQAIDEAITSFYETGYLHNHVRMYIAAIACNIAKSHWKTPAQWMYYHLLDGDWASNALSWQWVAGSNSNKKYYANQENINKYCGTSQRGTFLDVNYDDFEGMPIPVPLANLETPELKTRLPEKQPLNIDTALPTLIYNYYNLDPNWKKDINANRIFLLEPSILSQYPVSEKCIDFVLQLSANINGIQLFVGEFDELINEYNIREIFYKEHPLNKNYQGTEDARDWMFPVTGYFPSFFSYWKKCKKLLKRPI